MKPSFRKAFAAAGVDTTRRPSESSEQLAKDEIYHAQINCELQKARMTVRALMMINEVRNKRGGR